MQMSERYLEDFAVGAAAIGGYFGGRLLEAGRDGEGRLAPPPQRPSLR